MITESLAVNTASASSIKDQRMALGTDGKVLDITPTQPQQSESVNAMLCYHCPELANGMDEHGRPRLHCLLLGGAVNPQSCGRKYAGCQE